MRFRSESDETDQSVLGAFRYWYHVPALLLLFSYMLWVRIQSRDAFVDGQEIYFSGNDAWYHYRQVVYTSQNWPSTMPFDPWTYFPFGTSVGQFGTLFDQLVATGAILLAGGTPTERQAGIALMFAPAVFGALTIIPTYLLGKRLGGRVGGLLAAAILALLPGLFLQRSLVGAADHNGAEPLFQGFAILALMIAVTVTDRKRPVLEQFAERDFEGLRDVIGWSVLAGIATALYLWTWPPGVLIVGIFGLFVLLATVSGYYSGISPDHIAISAFVSMTTLALLMFVPFGFTGFSATNFSLLQPVLALSVGFGALFLAWIAREWESRDLDPDRYPIAIGGFLGLGILVLVLVLPDIYGLLANNLLRVVGFGTKAATRTIGEAQPWMSRSGQLGLGPFWVIFMEYGMAFYTALIGALWLLCKPHIVSRDTRRVGLVAAFLGVTVFLFLAPVVPQRIGGIVGIEGTLVSLLIIAGFLAAIIVTGQYRSEELLVLIWAAFITSAAFTQIRFNYYLAVAVAVFNAYLFAEIIGRFDFPSLASVRESVEERDANDLWSKFDTSQVLVVVLVLLLVLAPLATAQTVTNDRNQRVPMSTAQQVGNSTGPGDFQNWESSLEWMHENTPEEGDFAGSGNQFEYYGTYEQTTDHDYPEGTYGVMSWWDYGHWITVEAERIPNANPFQEGASTAANYLLAPSEDRAEGVLTDMDEDDAKTRYVMVDWQMIKVGSKFGAPIQFYTDGQVSRSDFYKPAIVVEQSGQGLQFTGWFSRQYVKDQRYYESMMVRLYRYHGSAKKPQPVVVDWDQEAQTGLGPTILMQNGSQQVREFDNMSAAREYVENDGSSQVGGISNLPSEYVPALQHYRLVALSEDQLAPANYIFNGELQNAPAYVKTFERVPGARVEGTGPENTVVEATVTMEITAYNQTFEYTQRAETGDDGQFEMILPYSTTGYDNWGPEDGYTNVSIRATGPYEFSTGPTGEGEGNMTTVIYNDTADVTEGQVIGEDESTVTVELERQVIDVPDGADQNNTTDNESSMMASDVNLDGSDGGSASSAASPDVGSSGAESTFTMVSASFALLGAFIITTRRWSP